MVELTKRQREVLGIIAKSRHKGDKLVMREIADLMGLRSHTGVLSHIRALVRKGYLDNDRRLTVLGLWEFPDDRFLGELLDFFQWLRNNGILLRSDTSEEWVRRRVRNYKEGK